jgi:hypothetical protein
LRINRTFLPLQNFEKFNCSGGAWLFLFGCVIDMFITVIVTQISMETLWQFFLNLVY